jgi:hypothetical protein
LTTNNKSVAETVEDISSVVTPIPEPA